MHFIVYLVIAAIAAGIAYFLWPRSVPEPRPLPPIVAYHPKCRVSVITMREPKRLRAQLPDAEFYPAVDGKQIDLSETREYLSDLLYNWFLKNPHFKGHLGCAMSHMFLWRKILEEGRREPTLILEDDAILTPEFGKIDEILATNADYDIMYLGGSCGYQTPKCHTNDGMRPKRNTVRVNYLIGMWGYVVPDARAAKLLLDSCVPLNLPVDHQISSADNVRKMLALPTLVDHPGRMTIDSFGYETNWDFRGYRSLTNN